MSEPDNQQKKTPLQAQDKNSIIEHLNEEHQSELIGFAQLYLQETPNLAVEIPNSAVDDIEQVNITEIYQQGIDLQVVTPSSFFNDRSKSCSNRPANTQPTLLFIPFSQAISNITQLQEQYIVLMQQVDKLRGKDSIKLTQQKFTVQSKGMVTDNMLRLVLATDESVLQYADAPGYAYLFDLTTHADELTHKLTREHCYYTLRKVFSENVSLDSKLTVDTAENQPITVWIDVYLHKDATNNTLTSGGLWATSLQVGDVVHSKREFPENLEHLHQGQSLLIADETSLPTISRLLEIWQNPLPPIVINITNEQADQAYLQQAKLAGTATAQALTLIPIVIHGSQDHLAEKIDTAIANFLAKNPITIDKVWGAMEAQTTKKLRRLLRDRLELSRTDCVLKVYWRTT